MITDGKKWHYIVVKSLSASLRGIKSNHDGDFYCLNCFHSHRTKEKLKKHEKGSWLLLCRNAWWRQQNIKIQPRGKVIKSSVYDYADLECLLEKMHSCQNNFEKSYTEKKK